MTKRIKFDKKLGYYVYVWLNQDNEPIYVGFGNGLRHSWWPNKKNCKCMLVVTNRLPNQARNFEAELISYLTSIGAKLYNVQHTNCKVIPSPETISLYNKVLATIK